MAREKACVLGGDPVASVLLGNDGNVTFCKHLISTTVVQMVVTVDGVENRLSGPCLDFLDQFLGRGWGGKRVDYENSTIADDETSVARRKAARFCYGREDSVGYLDQLEVVFGLCERRPPGN